jgi:hypothetical protein
MLSATVQPSANSGFGTPVLQPPIMTVGDRSEFASQSVPSATPVEICVREPADVDEEIVRQIVRKGRRYA